MCFFGGSGDGGAGAARAAEEARQARITSGTADVNQVFSKFDDPYYAGVTDAYSKYYNPQLDKQYNDARKKLILSLGAANNSSAGAKQIGDLDSQYQTNRQAVADQAVSAGADARGKVEDARSQVLQQLSASADPAAAAAAATGRSNQLATPPSFSPLGNLFANFAQMGANNILLNAANNGNRAAPLLFNSNGGSSRVVN